MYDSDQLTMLCFYLPNHIFASYRKIILEKEQELLEFIVEESNTEFKISTFLPNVLMYVLY